jgi:hypothetical protein
MTYPTITNGGLIFVALAAVVLIAAVYADSYCTNNPGAIIRQDLRTGAINNNHLQSQGAVMSDSTERVDAVLSAAGPRKPWWACHETVRDLDVPSEDCAAWVRWTSEPMAEHEDIEVCLERMVTLDEDLVVCDVEDRIRVECDDSTVFLPVGLADDAVALIRAASSIYGANLKPFTEPLEADGWVGPDGVTYPTKDDYYRAQEAPVILNSDGTMPLTPNRLDDEIENVFVETFEEARRYVVTALGDWGDDFDVDEITRMVFDFDTAEDADGIEHLNRQGFRLIATSEEFWSICRDNELHPRD